MKINLVLVIGFLSIYTMAQTKLPDSLNTPKKRTKILSTRMQKELHFTKNQFKKVNSLNIVYAIIMEKEVIKSGRSNWGKYWKTQSIINEKEIFLRRILDNEQLKKYKKMRSKAMNNIIRNAF